jgi:hypothetical protein
LEDLSVDETRLDQAFEDTDDVSDIITFLVGRNPGSLSACNQDGELPLHVASATFSPVEIIRCLVDLEQESILVSRTTDGAYPLYVALERGASSVSASEVIKLLLKRYDPVISMLQNNAGETPLHVACRCCVPFETSEQKFSLVHFNPCTQVLATAALQPSLSRPRQLPAAFLYAHDCDSFPTAQKQAATISLSGSKLITVATSVAPSINSTHILLQRALDFLVV